MSRKKLILIVTSTVLLAITIFLVTDLDNDGIITYQELSLSSDFNNPDSDGDKLLDGNSIILKDSDGLSQQLKAKEIVYRLNENGYYHFYGEQFFDADPCEPSFEAVNQTKFLSAISEQDFRRYLS